MKLILLASLALSAIAAPSGEEIFKRASGSFCKKAKSGCANTEEKQPVQNYCSSFLSLPPQKTKTFIDLETSVVYTTTKTTTITSYAGSYSGGPVNTRTNWETVTAADASTTTVTSNAGASGYAFPSQCAAGGSHVEVNKRAAATQPACFSKYALKTQVSSACGCFTLTATIPATSLIESTTTISTASMSTVTTTIQGPVDVTSTTTMTSGTSVTAVALQDSASGNYASYMGGDAAGFTSDLSGAAAWILGSDGELSKATGAFADSGSWQYAKNSPDFIRFENTTQSGYPMNPVTCQINSAGGSCTLNCVNSVYGWNQNCLYDEPNDSRNGGWIIAGPGIGFCSYVSAPLVVPLPNSA